MLEETYYEIYRIVSPDYGYMHWISDLNIEQLCFSLGSVPKEERYKYQVRVQNQKGKH